MRENEILNAVGSYRNGQTCYVRAMVDETSHLRAELRNAGVKVFRESGKVVRKGMDYEHFTSVKEMRADGKAPTENRWGHWLTGFENIVLVHNTKGNKYLSLRVVSEHNDNNIGNVSKYFLEKGGARTEIGFAEYLDMCTPSYKKSFENGEKPITWLVKFENILSIGKK